MTKKLLFGCLIIVLGLLASCKVQQPQEIKLEDVTVFRLAEVHPSDYPTTLANKEFARLVEEKTDGRIVIKVYDSEQLGPEISVLEQVQFGAIDFARTSVSPLSVIAPQMNVLQLPYLYKSGDHMWQVLNSHIGDYFLESIDDDGYIGLTYYDAGARNFYNSKKEVKTLEDLSGLRVRVMENQLMVDMAVLLGAIVTPMTYSEVYEAIQIEDIDGAENNFPSYASSLHFEVAQYYTIDEHIRVPEILLASKKIMDRISEEDLEIIKECAKESQTYQREKWMEMDKAYEVLVREAGSIITMIDDEERLRFIEAVQPIYEKYAGDFTAIIEEIQAME